MIRMGSAQDIAVTPVIGTILVISIMIAAIGIILAWGIPYMERMREYSEVQNILTQFRNINDVVKEVCREGENTTTIVRVTMREGNIHLDPKGDRIVIFYSTGTSKDYNFSISDLDNDNESIFIKCNQNFLCNATATWLNDSVSYSTTRNIGPSGEWFKFNRNLEGMVEIDLLDDNTGEEIGRIWIFDLGSLCYKLTKRGFYRILVENGAIISSNSPEGGYLEGAYCWKKGKNLAMRIYQLNVDSGVSLSGPATYRFVLKSNKTALRENRNKTTYNLKIQVHGDSREAWYSYFVRDLGFRRDGDTIYLPSYNTHTNALTFSLTHFVCDISYGGIG